MLRKLIFSISQYNNLKKFNYNVMVGKYEWVGEGNR